LVLFSLLAFLVVAGLVALLAAVIGVRTWWLRRRRPGTPRPRATGEVIEGEYRRVAARGDEREAGDRRARPAAAPAGLPGFPPGFRPGLPAWPTAAKRRKLASHAKRAPGSGPPAQAAAAAHPDHHRLHRDRDRACVVLRIAGDHDRDLRAPRGESRCGRRGPGPVAGGAGEGRRAQAAARRGGRGGGRRRDLFDALSPHDGD